MGNVSFCPLEEINADELDQAWFYKDCQEMQFGQGIPTARDKREFNFYTRGELS
jgi:hypothetical protein